MTRKTVFIGHPVGGDIKVNVEKVLKICAAVNTIVIIPIASFLISL